MYINNMINITGSTKTINDYLILLNNLDSSQKLRIISELSNSMVYEKEEKDKDKLFFSLCGKLQLDKDVDDFLNDIRKSRYFDSEREID